MWAIGATEASFHSPAALSASAWSKKNSRRTASPSRKVHTVPILCSTSYPVSFPRPNSRVSDDNLVAGVNELLGLDSILLPGLKPLGGKCQPALAAVKPAEIGHGRVWPDLDLGMEGLEHPFQVALGECFIGTPHDLPFSCVIA